MNPNLFSQIIILVVVTGVVVWFILDSIRR